MPGEVDIAKNVRVSRLLDFYGGLLTERQREISSLHYDEDLSLGEISQICGITRQGVLDSLKKSEAALTGFEQKLGLLERADALADRLARLADKLENETETPESLAAALRNISL